MLKKWTSKPFLLLCLLPLLVSCLDLDCEAELSEDLSGSARFVYSFPRAIAEIEQANRENRWQPFPLNEEDFAEMEAAYPAILFSEPSFSRDNFSYSGEISIEFASLEDLSDYLGYTIEIISPDEISYALKIALNHADGAKEDYVATWLETYFSDWELNFQIKVPWSVDDPGMGLYNAGEGTVSLSVNTNEVALSEEEVAWIIGF